MSQPYRNYKDKHKLLQREFAQAENIMKQFADKTQSVRSSEVGDLIYLSIQPYRQTFINIRKKLKLATKYFGPFPVEAKVGSVVYKFYIMIQKFTQWSMNPSFRSILGDM